LLIVVFQLLLLRYRYISVVYGRLVFYTVNWLIDDIAAIVYKTIISYTGLSPLSYYLSLGLNLMKLAVSCKYNLLAYTSIYKAVAHRP